MIVYFLNWDGLQLLEYHHGHVLSFNHPSAPQLVLYFDVDLRCVLICHSYAGGMTSSSSGKMDASSSGLVKAAHAFSNRSGSRAKVS